MRTLKTILIVVTLFLIPSYSYSSGLGSLRISLIQGDVRVMPATSYEWLPVSLNMPLREGDTLWVPEAGRLEIQTNDGSFLRLDEYSTLEIISISRGIMWSELKEGRAYVNFKGLRDMTLQLDIPYFSNLKIHEPSKFSIDLHNYRYVEISVFKGVVYADVRGEMTDIYAGQSLTIGEDMYTDISSVKPSDRWELWNRERDRRFEGSWYSYRYLPDELRVYAYEFDTSGKWVYTTRYGYVWVPTVYVTTNWSPYRVGRWVWIDDEYVWVSDEPWGWVPYHYGRWAFSISIGWFWVPPSRGAVYWGPGFVGWIHTPTYVAWVPLAPEDIYYGYGYYGPRSVNIIHIDIHKTVIKNVYKNVYVNNAVTVVHRDSFIKGKYIAIKTDRNPFTEEGIRQGRIRIVSDRVSLAPITRKVMVKNEPAKIIIRDVDKVRHEREKDNIRRQTTKQRARYPEEIRRDTIKIQRKEASSHPERMTIEKEQKVRRPEVSREPVRKEPPHKDYLTNRQPHSKGEFHIAEKGKRDSSEKSLIRKDKKGHMVLKEGKQIDTDISQWILR